MKISRYSIMICIFIFLAALAKPVAADDESLDMKEKVLASTPMGSWQVREVLRIHPNHRRTLILSKIARVENDEKHEQGFVSLEISHQFYHLTSSGKRKKTPKYFMLRVVMKEQTFINNLLTLESCPLIDAVSIALKIGEEDPTYILPENAKSFLEAVGFLPAYPWQLSPSEGDWETIVIPVGQLSVVKSQAKLDPKCLQFQPIGATVTSDALAHFSPLVPFGVVKRRSIITLGDERLIEEVQTVDFGYRGTFSKMLKVFKKSPINLLEKLVPGF